MNRSLKIKSLYMLSLFLMVQPAVHCFGLEQLKTSLIQNFHHVKPYFTRDNVITAVLGTMTGVMVGVSSYILYKAVKSREIVIPEPRSIEECVAHLVKVVTEIQESVKNEDFIILRVEQELERINSAIGKFIQANSEIEAKLIEVGSKCVGLLSAIQDYNSRLQRIERGIIFNKSSFSRYPGMLRILYGAPNLEKICGDIIGLMRDEQLIPSAS